MLLVKLFSNEIDITLSEGDYHHNRAGLFQSVEDLEIFRGNPASRSLSDSSCDMTSFLGLQPAHSADSRLSRLHKHVSQFPEISHLSLPPCPFLLLSLFIYKFILDHIIPSSSISLEKPHKCIRIGRPTEA